MGETRDAVPDEADLPTGAGLSAARLFFSALMLLAVAALLGDVIIWAVKGTQYALSPSFARLGTKMAGFNEVVLAGAYGGVVKDKIEKRGERKGRKMWLLAALLSLAVLLAAGLPLAAFVLVFVRHFGGGNLHVARLGAALMAHPVGLLWLLLVAVLLSAVLACKWYVLSQLWQFTVPLFQRQPQKRFVIGSE